MNYVNYRSQEIIDNKSNRLELEEIKLEIRDNLTYKVDKETQGELNDLWRKIDEYVLLSRQRSRLQYIAEQKKADAIKKAIPNPMFLISYIISNDPVKNIISIVSASTTSSLSYYSDKYQNELEILMQNWKLDDTEYKAISEQSLDLINYCQNIVRKYNYPNEKAIRQGDIERFLSYKNDTNLQRRLDNLLADNKFKDAFFTSYYILLGSTYYELAEQYETEEKHNNEYIEKLYTGCIDSFRKYQTISKNFKIYNKDIDLARFLPKVISAGKKILPKNEYIKLANECINIISNETMQDNWDLRYFAATVAIQLADLDSVNKKKYYNFAKELLLSNIRYLSDEQEKTLNKYVLPVNAEIPAALTDKHNDKKTYKQMIKIEENARKTKLIPDNNALILNTELLFFIRDYLPELRTKWNAETVKIIDKSILNMNLRYKYGLDIIEDFETGGFSYNKNDSKDITITIPYSDVFSGNNTSKIILPGILVSDTSSITIIAKQENSDTFMQEIKMSDITDYEVSRPKDLKKDFSFEEEKNIYRK